MWPEVRERLQERAGPQLRVASVFMTAFDPAYLLSLPEAEAREYIQREAQRNLTWRNKDDPVSIEGRAAAAPGEILAALRESEYERVFYSSPEGPDGQDDWTRGSQPVERAKQVLDEFVRFVRARAEQ